MVVEDSTDDVLLTVLVVGNTTADDLGTRWSLVYSG